MDQNQKDDFFKYGMLASGILTSLLFFTSLILLAEAPGAFMPVAIAMVVCGIIFFILRTLFKYRSTFKITDKKKPPSS